ncbi:hypothetical protein GOV03_04435 [Candidatus Woesearchaeota archaeon]|nr:hypothetical protein [Candidatus Woesearchaeota archaeon]
MKINNDYRSGLSEENRVLYDRVFRVARVGYSQSGQTGAVDAVVMVTNSSNWDSPVVLKALKDANPQGTIDDLLKK